MLLLAYNNLGSTFLRKLLPECRGIRISSHSVAPSEYNGCLLYCKNGI